MPVIESIITEGALTFTFPPDGLASKYDAWSHYRNQFQKVGDSKAVDIVFAAREIAWLIEVKDFRLHPRTKAIELADEIAIKVRDTLAGLVSAGCNAADADERNCARELVSARTIRVVCHLEQVDKQTRLRPKAIEPDKLLLKLKTLIKAIDPHPTVVDKDSRNPALRWSVA